MVTVRGTVLGLAVALLGCGSEPVGNVQKTVPVTGIVTFEGQPLADAEIQFTPAGSGGGSAGRTDAEGRYALNYGPSAEGAIPGFHNVSILVGESAEAEIRRDDMTPRELSEAMKAAAIPVLSPRYTDGQGGLTAVVPPDGGEINFALTASGNPIDS